MCIVHFKGVDTIKFKIIISSLIFWCLALSINISAYTNEEIYNNRHGIYIYNLYKKHLISDIANNRFYPKNSISRKDAILMLVYAANKNGTFSINNLEKLQKQSKKIKLPKDIQNDSSKEIFSKLISLGIIDANEAFRPNDMITREEIAVFIYRYFNCFSRFNNSIKNIALDIDNNSSKEQISILLSNNIMSTDYYSNFKPKDRLTRGEMAQIIAKILNIQVEMLPKDHKIILDVPYVSDIFPLYAAISCEPTSLYSALKYKGYVNNTSHKKFLDDMPKHSYDPNKGFVGSPFGTYSDKTKRETIFPSPLTKYAKRYGNVENLTGSAVKKLQDELYMNNPVMVYLTFKFEYAQYANYNINGKTEKYLFNNHAVVLCGYDPSSNKYYVSDPYNKEDTKNEYKYWVDGVDFENSYNIRKQAIVVR